MKMLGFEQEGSFYGFPENNCCVIKPVFWSSVEKLNEHVIVVFEK